MKNVLADALVRVATKQGSWLFSDFLRLFATKSLRQKVAQRETIFVV